MAKGLTYAIGRLGRAAIRGIRRRRLRRGKARVGSRIRKSFTRMRHSRSIRKTIYGTKSRIKAKALNRRYGKYLNRSYKKPSRGNSTAFGKQYRSRINNLHARQARIIQKQGLAHVDKIERLEKINSKIDKLEGRLERSEGLGPELPPPINKVVGKKPTTTKQVSVQIVPKVKRYRPAASMANPAKRARFDDEGHDDYWFRYGPRVVY